MGEGCPRLGKPGSWGLRRVAGKGAAGPANGARRSGPGTPGSRQVWPRGATSRRERRRESACKPGSVVDSHSSRTCVTASLQRPTRGHARAARCGSEPLVPLFGLAPGGVYPATGVAVGAVRSYRTISPLPIRRGGLRRYLFCGTCRGLAPPRRYLAPCPVEPGLSSPRAPRRASSDCPADSLISG